MKETTSISSEIDHTLNQELEISTLLSELYFMLRQPEAVDAVPTPNYTDEEETKAWTVLWNNCYVWNIIKGVQTSLANTLF